MKTTPEPRETIVLELVAVEDPFVRTHGERYRRHPDQRLRAALKTLLRVYGLKCNAIRTAGPGAIIQEDPLPPPEGSTRVA